MSSNVPEQSSLPLAVQLSATPPASASRRSPVVSANRPHRARPVRRASPPPRGRHPPAQPPLQPGGHVPVHVADLGVGMARRHQTLGETGARREIVLALLPRPVEPEQGDADPPVGLELHRLFEEPAETLAGGEGEATARTTDA